MTVINYLPFTVIIHQKTVPAIISVQCALHNVYLMNIWCDFYTLYVTMFFLYRMAATCVVQPLDLIKTRMQLSGGSRTSFAVAGEIVAREGFFSLYTGLSAGLLRQATYTTTRLGVYSYLFDFYKEWVLSFSCNYNNLYWMPY